MEDNVKRFLEQLVPHGEIEYNELNRALRIEEIEWLKKDIYFLGGVTDGMKRNWDNDIIDKRYFVVDYDLRENYKKVTGELLSDEKLHQMLEHIVTVIEDTEFEQWRYVVFSGNGFHFYYTSADLPMEKLRYKDFVEYLYQKLDKLFMDPIFKVDHSCVNIWRILRLPGTTNRKRKVKHGLEPAVCEILLDIDRDFPAVIHLGHFEEISLKKIAWEEIRQAMARVSDNQLEAILNIPMEELVLKYSGIELMSDKKNFKSPKDGSRVGMFLHDNVLYHTGTHHIHDAFKGYNTFLFVKEHYGLKTNKTTFDWFRAEYPDLVDVKPRAKTIEAEDMIEIDFKHKLPFTWGLKQLDRKFGRYDINRFNVIIGESWSGKTEYTFFQARENAKTNKVLYLSLEMMPKNLMIRYAMKRAWVTQIQRSDKSLSMNQQQLMKDYILEVQSIKNLKILGMENPSMLDIIKTVQEYYAKWYTLFYIDNMWFIYGQGEEIESTKEISRQMKALTNQLPISINLIHHLRKWTTKERKSARGLADIRSSGKIENDADNVLQIRRNLTEEEMTPEERSEVMAILHKDRDFWQPASGKIWFYTGKYHGDNPRAAQRAEVEAKNRANQPF